MAITTEKRSDAAVASVSDITTECIPAYGARTVVRFDDGQTYRSVPGHEYLHNIFRMIDFFGKESTGQRVVATLMMNRPEWDMAALASLYTANILSPLDTKMNDGELRHLMAINPPDFVVVSKAQRERLRRLLEEMNLCPRILIADLYPVFEDLTAQTITPDGPYEIRMSDLTDVREARGASPLLDVPGTELARYATSGTTSLPKVVSITHENILFQLSEALGMINLRKNEDVLSIGPYTHIATLLEFLVSRSKAFTVTYFTREAEDDGVLETEIRKIKSQGVRIRCLMAVPKFWTYVLKEVLEEMNNKPVFRNLYEHLIAIERSDHFYDIGTMDKAKLIAARTLLRNKLGGHFAFGISSSSKVEPGVVEILAKLGITIIDVYGATELSGVIAKNDLNRSRRGFCGRLLDDFDFKLNSETFIPGVKHRVGELHLKGPGLAAGYVGESERLATDDEGYYNTGDIAYVDEDRWVYLVGRKKELIVWESGHLTDPMHVSNLLVRSIWVRDALVMRRDDESFLSAFLLPDTARIEKSQYYRDRLAKGLDPSQILRPLLEEAIDYAQSLLGACPRISKERIYLLNRRLERTPTHKIKYVNEVAKLDFGRYI